MRHPSDRSFLFHRASKGIVEQTAYFFGRNTLAASRKEEDFYENPLGLEYEYLKHYHTFALMNDRPNKGDT